MASLLQATSSKVLQALNLPYSNDEGLLGSRVADICTLPLLLAIIFPLARKLLTRWVYRPAGLRFMYKNKRPDEVDKPEVAADRFKKWNESCWKLTVFSLFTSLALAVSYGEPWLYDTKYYWLGCTKLPCDFFVSKKLLLFYCVETGFYIQAIPFLWTVEVRRHDWLESLIHHVVTLGLLFYSYYLNLTRVGIILMLVHDVSDVFLEAAKLGRYSKRQDVAMVFFGIFTVVWIASRCVYFPLVVIRSTLTEPITLVAKVYNIEPEPHYTIFNGLLITLFVLHLYWTYFILRILIKQLLYGDAGDVREDDE